MYKETCSILIYNSTKNGNFIDDISKVDVVFQPQEDDAEFQEKTINEKSAEEDLLEEHEMELALQENEDKEEEKTLK